MKCSKKFISYQSDKQLYPVLYFCNRLKFFAQFVVATVAYFLFFASFNTRHIIPPISFTISISPLEIILTAGNWSILFEILQ